MSEEKPDEQALEALAAAADGADADDVKINSTCPSCGDVRCRLGELNAGVAGRIGFVPAGQTMGVGYTVRSAVCLNCGHVRHFLGAADVKAIRDKR